MPVCPIPNGNRNSKQSRFGIGLKIDRLATLTFHFYVLLARNGLVKVVAPGLTNNTQIWRNIQTNVGGNTNTMLHEPAKLKTIQIAPYIFPHEKCITLCHSIIVAPRFTKHQQTTFNTTHDRTNLANDRRTPRPRAETRRRQLVIVYCCVPLRVF